MALVVDIDKDLGSFHLSIKFEARQEVMGILGASGCGKSMTLRCIAGVVKPERGRILFNGTTLFDSEKGINLPPQKRHVGLLFQNYALFPNMTVYKNLMMGLKAVEKDRKKAEKAVREMMDRFYLTGLENHKPFQLSGGQQQRTALARILLAKPDLLMLDEPFSALDGYLRWKLELELMDILKEFPGPTLFVSHSRDEIYRLCHRACVMDKGTSTPVVPVKAMFEEPETLSACLLSGCKNYSVALPDREKGQDTWIYARDWGVSLNCGHPVPEGISYIGVRSHYLHLLRKEEIKRVPNVMEGEIQRIIEDVFNMVVMVKPVHADHTSDNRLLRMEMTKAEWESYVRYTPAKEGDRLFLWIAPRDILVLK